MTISGIDGGPASTALAAELRDSIEDGALAPGGFLPSVRQLKESKGLAHQTVYNALRVLVADGYVMNEPGRGYRVLARANDPDRGCPLACIFPALDKPEPDVFLLALKRELEEAARAQGWSLLVFGSNNGDYEATIKQCIDARAWGVISSAHVPDVINLANNAGLTSVMVDSWNPEAGVDAVVQDGLGGGMLAARYLARRGHQRIGWLGAATGTVHGYSRFGGAVSGLLNEGITLDPKHVFDVNDEPSLDKAIELLSGPDRPTGVLAIVADKCREIYLAAEQLGLRVGEDLEVVGWCAEECEAEYLDSLPGNARPPRIRWRIRTLAETAIERLAQRRLNPQLPAIRTNVTVQLVD